MKYDMVNLSELVLSVAEELRSAEPDRNVELVVQEGIVARADLQLLGVVLENLLGNAWKFTGRHLKARIEFGVTEKDGQAVYFVRDDGAGFETAYVDKLFATFQRLHADKEFPGNGIGLALSQRIIHRHGGKIWAEGAVEQGATFYFTLTSRKDLDNDA